MKKQTQEKGEIPIFKLWDKYESIAMHFNDLIVRIRIQALGGVATITTIGAVFINNSSGGYDWNLIAVILLFLMMFWIAIWILDLSYYNRLLNGAVTSILKLENLTKKGELYTTKISLSTDIKKSVDNNPLRNLNGSHWFYIIVFAVLLIAFLFALQKTTCGWCFLE